MVKNLPANAGDTVFPGLGRSPGEGNGSPLQYSCLRNPMLSMGPNGLHSAWDPKRVRHDLVTKQQQQQLRLSKIVCLLAQGEFLL